MNLVLLVIIMMALAALGSYFTARSTLGLVAWILMIQPWGLFLCGKLGLLPTLAIDATGVALFYLVKKRAQQQADTSVDDQEMTA